MEKPVIHCLRSLVEKSGGIRQPVGVKLAGFFLSFLVAALLAGCEKNETAAPPSADDSLPTQAQPKLPTMKIYLGAEILDAELATTGREQMTGMMFRTNVTDTDAMLFIMPYPQRASFWMKNCPHSLSAAYITADGVIQEIRHLEKNDTNYIVAESGNIQYVLEVNDGWFQRHNISTGTVIRTEKGSLQETFFPN